MNKCLKVKGTLAALTLAATAFLYTPVKDISNAVLNEDANFSDIHFFVENNVKSAAYFAFKGDKPTFWMYDDIWLKKRIYNDQESALDHRIYADSERIDCSLIDKNKLNIDKFKFYKDEDGWFIEDDQYPFKDESERKKLLKDAVKIVKKKCNRDISNLVEYNY